MVGAVAPAVSDVRLVGEWSAGDTSGVYRVVIVSDPDAGGTSRLFVQWMKTAEPAPTVDKSVEIAELGQLGVVVFDFTYESDNEGLSLFIDAFDPANGSEAAYELFLKAPDDYLFQPISN
ncbi:MAG: hypothetical protein R3D02_04305 [Hyphomicrobiales bacterium]